jgi:TRAP-type C4-dicarboxylate transport system substrate-binding protein
MFRVLTQCTLLSMIVWPTATVAEPIKLKLSYYTSDREVVYRTAVKPFVDAVNSAANGSVQIDTYLSSVLGSYSKQAELVLNGTIDLAFVNPGLTPELFPDESVVQLPGLFRDTKEASFAYTRLVASGKMRGHEKYFTVAAIAAGPQYIHTRSPVASLGDLKARKLRSTNDIEAMTLSELGLAPKVIPINQTADAISGGEVDGTTAPPVVLVEFGLARTTRYHYLISLGVVPLLIIMNKETFDKLPPAARDIICQYSGEWLAARFTQTFAVSNELAMEQLQSDPKRVLIVPSRADLDLAQNGFRSVIDNWTAIDPHNRDMLEMLRNELAKLRAHDVTRAD